MFFQAPPAAQHRGLPGGRRLHRLALPPHRGRPLHMLGGGGGQQGVGGGLPLEQPLPQLPLALPLRQPEARLRLRPRAGHHGHTADKLTD